MTTEQEWVLVEHHGSAADRSVVEEVGALTMCSEDAAEMNKAMVRTPCRLYPAIDFRRGSQ